jgi:hypothetical protein
MKNGAAVPMSLHGTEPQTRFSWLLNTLVAPLAVSGANSHEERVGGAEHGSSNQQRQRRGYGPAMRIASDATLRDAPASSNPAPTDMPIEIA